MIQGRLVAVAGVLLLLIVASVDALLLLDPGAVATRGALLGSVTGRAHAQRLGTSFPVFDTRAPCDHSVMAGKTDSWTVAARDAAGTPGLSVSGLPPYGSFTDSGHGTATLSFRPPIDTSGTDLTMTILAAQGSGTASLNCTERVIASPRTPPVVALKVAPSTGRLPLAVTADATDSVDADAAKPASYRFDFGDGTLVGPQPGPAASYTYRFAGSYTVTVLVTDRAGLSAKATAPVLVTLAPSVLRAPTPTATPKP